MARKADMVDSCRSLLTPRGRNWTIDPSLKLTWIDFDRLHLQSAEAIPFGHAKGIGNTVRYLRKVKRTIMAYPYLNHRFTNN
jgi:hypothetical protein